MVLQWCLALKCHKFRILKCLSHLHSKVKIANEFGYTIYSNMQMAFGISDSSLAIDSACAVQT